MENTTNSKITKEFLKKHEKKGKIINVSLMDLPKSYILVKEKDEEKLYISPISSQTLLKRANEEEI